MDEKIMKHFVEAALKAVGASAEVTIQADFDHNTDFAVVVDEGDFVFYCSAAMETHGGLTRLRETFHLDVAHHTPGSFHEPPDVDIEELEFPSFVNALDEMCKRILDTAMDNIALGIEYAKDEESGIV